MESDLRISGSEVIKLTSAAFEMGLYRGLRMAALKDKYISCNKAYKIFTRSRVEKWIENGLIKEKPNGNGKTSKKLLESEKLMELDLSERIVIYKSN